MGKTVQEVLGQDSKKHQQSFKYPIINNNPVQCSDILQYNLDTKYIFCQVYGQTVLQHTATNRSAKQSGRARFLDKFGLCEVQLYCATVLSYLSTSSCGSINAVICNSSRTLLNTISIVRIHLVESSA